MSEASGGRLTLPSGARVVVAKGAVSGSGHLAGSVVSPPAQPAGLVRLVGSTYHFEVTGARLTGQVKLRLPVPGAGSGPEPAWLAYFSNGRWVPVASSYDPKTQTVTGTSTHLSVWSVVELVTGTVTNQLSGLVKGFFGVSGAAQPTCPGSAAAAGAKVSSSSGTLVKWCAGSSSGQTVLRVTNAHGYAVEVDYPQGWSVTRLGQEADWQTRLLQDVSAWLSPQSGGQKAIVVPGGGEIQFTIPAGESGEATARPSGQSALVSAFILGVETLAMTFDRLPWWPAASASKLTTVVQLADHSSSCVRSGESLVRNSTLSASGVGGLIRSDTDLAVNCLADEWEVGFGETGAIASAAVGVVLWAVDALKLLVDDVWGLVDAVRYLTGYDITVQLALACSPQLLFQAAVNKEHFNPQDPSYAALRAVGNGPGAYEVRCDGGWAVAAISRPKDGTTDGETVFKKDSSGTWVDVGMIGGYAPSECVLEPLGVPGPVASVLAKGVVGSPICDNSAAYSGAQQEWKSAVCDSAAQQSGDWVQAATQLQYAEPAYAGDPSGYEAAISELKAIAAIPDTGTTPAQQDEMTSDVQKLDTFFNTPGLYITATTSC